MNIIEGIRDPNLFRVYVTGKPDGSLNTWQNWMSFLKVLHGIETDEREHDVIRKCTGRNPQKLSRDGYTEAVVLAGRRSGKSKTIALAGAYEAVLSGKHEGLSCGEIPMVAIVSPTRNQSRIIHSYLRSIFDSSPILQHELKEKQRDSFVLTTGVEIAIVTGDPKRVRGFTVIAAIIDEVSMFHLAEDSRVRSDTELIRSIRPSLASTGGRLLCVGTPYQARGYSYETWKRAYGNDDCDVLCWNAPSLLMNVTLSPRVVERALAEDPIAARCEYCVEPGVFREDVDDYVARAVVESLVVRGRRELPPRRNVQYRAFADVSGGRHDDACLAIGHQEQRVAVIDCLARFKAPHNPFEVVAQMAETIRRYNLQQATGDAYAAEWTRTAFKAHGIVYRRASQSQWKEGAAIKHQVPKSKNELYASLLPRLHSAEIELPDDETLIQQLSSLQRRTRSGGRDVIDHPPGGHDDTANVVAGVADLVSQRRVILRPLF